MDRCRYTDFLAFLVIMLSLINLSATRDTAMAEIPTSAHDVPSPIRGPVFISTVYPAIEVDRDLVELVDPITDAYSFWGKILISSIPAMHKTFFPTPLSYPYRFSEKGAQIIKHKLAQIPEVDNSTIMEKTLPNLHQDEQHYYSKDEMEKFLIKERYIRFKIKKDGWDKIEVLKFPTFAVVAFDYTATPVKSVQEYRQLASDWKEKFETFKQFTDLRRVLQISQKADESLNIPILTFAAFPSYGRQEFLSHYFAGVGVIVEESNQLRFLREVRLLGFLGTTYNRDPALSHCFGISHDYRSSFPLQRFYYTSYPLFYHGNNWFMVEDGSLSPTVVTFPFMGFLDH